MPLFDISITRLRCAHATILYATELFTLLLHCLYSVFFFLSRQRPRHAWPPRPPHAFPAMICHAFKEEQLTAAAEATTNMPDATREARVIHAACRA